MKPDTKTEQHSPVFFNKGLIALIAGICIVLIALLATGMQPAGQGSVVPPAACGERTISFINNNLVTAGTSAELISIAEKGGLYEIKCLYQMKEITLYTSKDCTMLFTNAINMNASEASRQAPQVAQAAAAPVKSARPAVDLYVMSFCPYGTQAETVMGPVFELLRTKADIRIRYIATITGTTAGSVDSLHGPAEANEDLQQLCINKYFPEQYWAYLNTFNNDCYPSWQNTALLESCRKNTTAALSIDVEKIDSCAGGAEGLALLRSDEIASAKDGASASPMLFINGVLYSGSRTPEAYKQAICNSFETPPAECSTILSSQTAASATGGCG